MVKKYKLLHFLDLIKKINSFKFFHLYILKGQIKQNDDLKLIRKYLFLHYSCF